jgi:PLD-like domain
MFNYGKNRSIDTEMLICSMLFNQTTFYKAFLKDLRGAKHSVVIECPFITIRRLETLMPALTRLTNRNVRLIVNTKPVHEHESIFAVQAMEGIERLQGIGALVLLTGGHHRKLAVIDNQIVWEGSLNILSNNDSCEIMRRICSEQMANQMLAFLNIDKFFN